MNNVTIIGRVGQNPTLRHTNAGTAVCDLRVAVPTSKDDQPPTWVTVTCWAGTAEAIAQYIKTGREIAIEGELVPNEWIDNTSKRRYDIKINARKVTFLRQPKDTSDTTTVEAQPDTVNA